MTFDFITSTHWADQDSNLSSTTFDIYLCYRKGQNQVGPDIKTGQV